MSYSASINAAARQSQSHNRTGHFATHAAAIARRVVRAAASALLEANRRKAEREMARFLERSGGRLTDDMERRFVGSLSRSNFKL